MENQEVLKFKDYTRVNNHYLKISLTERCLSLIGFNTEILDNNLRTNISKIDKFLRISTITIITKSSIIVSQLM